jgi:hypothetical protein
MASLTTRKTAARELHSSLLPLSRLTLPALLLIVAAPVSAQDMEPKAYSASPVGTTFVVVAASRNTGSVVFDPTLPIRDVEARIGGVGFGVGITFGLFNKLTLVSAVVPVAWGTMTGIVGEDARQIDRQGLADSRFKLSMNLRGNDAMRLREFVKAPPRMIIGTSLTLVAPTGQYYDTKLINLGAHRWAFKPELGISVPKGPWDIDAYGGVWLFTSNEDFYPGGLRRTQEPVVALQGHVSYTIKPRMWLAFDGTWYSGGSTEVEDGEPTVAVSNSRLGTTLSLPVGQRQSFKISYSTGVVVRTGTDFHTLAVGWQWLFFRP